MKNIPGKYLVRVGETAVLPVYDTAVPFVRTRSSDDAVRMCKTIPLLILLLCIYQHYQVPISYLDYCKQPIIPTEDRFIIEDEKVAFFQGKPQKYSSCAKFFRAVIWPLHDRVSSLCTYDISSSGWVSGSEVNHNDESPRRKNL